MWTKFILKTLIFFSCSVSRHFIKNANLKINLLGFDKNPNARISLKFRSVHKKSKILWKILTFLHDPYTLFPCWSRPKGTKVTTPFYEQIKSDTPYYSSTRPITAEPVRNWQTCRSKEYVRIQRQISIILRFDDVIHFSKKFEMFQTIISFLNLMPPVFTLAYVQYSKLKSRYNLQTRHFDMFAWLILSKKGV